MKILITGGAGFIGSHVVEHILKNTDWDIIILDRLSYSSQGLDRLRDIECFDRNADRVKMFTADFTNPIVDGLAREIGQVDYILHMGAETHVDNSIANPEIFVKANVMGTLHMLNFARTQKDLSAFIYFSTDEVFGAAPEGVQYKEYDRYNSGNPYAASKAAGEELAVSFANTYHIPVLITHTMNVFGERQHPEKFIPKVINALKNGDVISIHANADKTKSGSRYWIHARNVASALLFILEHASIDMGGEHPYSEKFNIVGECEVSNFAMATTISTIMDKDMKCELVDYHSSRPGHDLRYALDGSKLEKMGWIMPSSFTDSLKKTVEWSLNNPKWLK